MLRQQRIAMVVARQETGQRQLLWQARWHVLETVHRHIDLAREHHRFQLVGEKPLVANLRQRHIEDLVAFRLEVDDLKLRICEYLFQLFNGVARLPECKLAVARAYLNDFLRHCPVPINR